MIAHINGKLVEKEPTHVIIEASGVGYELKISLNTFSNIGSNESLKLFTHFVVREDAQLLYGFKTTLERDMFRQLISVSGVGPNTAIIMLSSLSTNEIANGIVNEDVNLIKSVKGIGVKTAQRVIIELKDKVLFALEEEISSPQHNTVKLEALTALVALGFDKKKADKALSKINDNELTVENLIKEGLKRL
jgi:holliday junction DNA helicase RuvA